MTDFFATGGADLKDDKFWLGAWVAYSACAAIVAVAELAAGGDWVPQAVIALMGALVCQLYWRILREATHVAIVVTPSRRERTCPSCGGELDASWAWCPECGEWREA